MKPEGYEKTKMSFALQLCVAVEEQDLQEIWKLLHCSGADPNILIPEKGISPFHLVIGCDCDHFAEEATRIFLQYNADPNVRNEDGLTPVHVAAVWGRTALLVLLLSCGGDPWIRDTEQGLTPLHLALKEKHLETALVLQRYQLVDRRNRYSEGHKPPRFNINFEAIVVSTGEMQAEYVLSPQDNVSPLLMSPVQGLHRVNRCTWNIEPLPAQEYVRQWCHKEFTPLQATSTPTQMKPLNYFNIANQLPAQVRDESEMDVVDSSPNITSTKQITPKVNYGANSVTSLNSPLSRNLLKGSSDVRKKLFLELKKRFNGLKQTFEGSKDNVNRSSNLERKDSVGYFGRRSIARIDKVEKGDIQPESGCKLVVDASNKSASEILSFKTSKSVALRDKNSISYPSADTEMKSSLENSPIDEIDAIPLDGSDETSVEWIASQSCFSEQPSPDSTNSQLYFTCDEGSSSDVNVALMFEQPNSLLTPKGPVVGGPLVTKQVSEAPQRPPRRKELKAVSNAVTDIPSNAPSTSFGTIVSEEFLYTDDEAGVVLIENRLLIKPVDVPCPSDTESIFSVPHSSNSDAPTATSDVSTIPASFSYDTLTLRKELIALGEAVGPITSTTKKVYLRRLYKLKKSKTLPLSISVAPEYPCELQRVFRGQDWETEILTFSQLETIMSAPFDKPDPNRRWREGVAKSSFNYLLLDPRFSDNLPAQVQVHDLRTWHQFISAVFYVGKGKRSRPYAHLYQAVHSWNKGEKFSKTNTKVQRILDIWREGHGVVCLHVFQNIIPVEAFTREAAMLDAIGINNLVNMKGGEYYGPASTWRSRQKRQLGIYLLYRAMRIFLCEGERQLRPGDID